MLSPSTDPAGALPHCTTPHRLILSQDHNATGFQAQKRRLGDYVKTFKNNFTLTSYVQFPEHEHRAATACYICILSEEIYRKSSQTSAGLLPAYRRYVLGGSTGKTRSAAVRRQNAGRPYSSSEPEGKKLEEPPAASRSSAAALRTPPGDSGTTPRLPTARSARRRPPHVSERASSAQSRAPHRRAGTASRPYLRHRVPRKKPLPGRPRAPSRTERCAAIAPPRRHGSERRPLT